MSASKTFIVIERHQHGELQYWRPGMKMDGWTGKIDEAVKFADHDSANHVLTRLCDGIGRSCEHAFIQSFPKQTAAQLPDKCLLCGNPRAHELHERVGGWPAPHAHDFKQTFPAQDAPENK